MKRLIKKSDSGSFDAHTKQDYTEIEKIEENPDGVDGLIKLDELSEADVRHERCPVCKYHPISRFDGFKQCPKCQQVFKILNGVGYMVSK